MVAVVVVAVVGGCVVVVGVVVAVGVAVAVVVAVGRCVMNAAMMRAGYERARSRSWAGSGSQAWSHLFSGAWSWSGSGSRLGGSRVAIASKEDSRVDVEESELLRNELALSLYSDKRVFGGGVVTVTRSRLAGNGRDFDVEPGSNLRLIEVERETTDHLHAMLGRLFSTFIANPSH